MSNPFNAKIEPSSPTFTLSATALILGLMIGLAWVTNQERQRNIPNISEAVKFGSIDMQRANLEMQSEVKGLRAQLAKFEKAASTKNTDNELVEESLQKYRVAAGLTELTGPGIVVTLLDSKRKDIFASEGIIHDVDILRVVNELWAAGAEAIAINGQRVVAGTAFRCVGPVIQINYVATSPPVRIQALGDREELYKSLQLPGGPVEEMTSVDPKMVEVEKVDKFTVPAFSGAMSPKISTAPNLGAAQ